MGGGGEGGQVVFLFKRNINSYLNIYCAQLKQSGGQWVGLGSETSEIDRYAESF